MTLEAKYQIVKKEGEFELRDYTAQILAEIGVDGELEDAGKKAFQPLFQYISGQNQSENKIAMTAPVGVEKRNEKWAVSFMMPADYSLQTLPRPHNRHIELRQIPARRMAAMAYSGFWSESNYKTHHKKLQQWISEQHLHRIGEPIWARYNSPFMPWFLRRNEILIPVNVL
jgi:hypothetical protein